ncbi:alpha/beta-type small acid-soluble spore protein [Risungbinella massiliensis]|uniref:alpha/beta-type small acid-soluble spore protein n=1 Tax=Risungbinella massiliensis TaxID=1329796 RepID=UPI0005CBD6DE|nr:alpha/beta-type small acid-soluble spore protein [Risungbinella massiliensis]
MSRRKKRKLLVPEARAGLDRLQTEMMNRELGMNATNTNDVKVEVANQLGISLDSYNPDIRAEDAGKIGGAMGGKLVREMIRMSMERLAKKH